MRFLAAVIVLATCLAAVSIGSAQAAAPPRVEAFHCSYLVSSVGAANVWQTWFNGERSNLFDRVTRLIAAPCFQTEANCKAWLYWAQSDYTDYSTFRPCRRGLNY